MSSLDADPSTAPPAEAELVRRYWDRVRLFAVRRTGDAAAAEDVAQETLRRVLDALRADRVADIGALPGFVFQTARHVCLHHARSAAREGRALARLSEVSDRPPAPDALGALVSAERAAAVRAALEEMPEDDRTLLRAIYFDQTEPDEVAARLRVSAGALRVRKHRALKRLADRITRNDPAGSGT